MRIGRLSAGPDGVLGSGDDVACEFRKPGLLNPQQIASRGSGSSLQVYFTEGEGNSVSVLTEVEANRAGAPTHICTPVPAEQLLDFEIITIRNAMGRPVLEVDALLAGGNHQAHAAVSK